MAVLHGWRLCPRCGAELDLMDLPRRVACPVCGFVAYANPKPAAVGLITDDAGRLLLVRRAVEPYRDCWDAPGGFVEEGEHPLDALRRELVEETGYEVEPGRFVGAWMDTYGDQADAQSTLNLYWEADIVSGSPRPADDVAELAWFERDALPPPEQLAFTTVGDALEHWRNVRRAGIADPSEQGEG
jgi:ADP-ribose pyrophosphatase YjhB (NUDIX family)